MNTTNASVFSSAVQNLNIPYTICEVLVAIMAIIGNALVIIVFRKERRLRRRTNYYIISLATADFLVGLLGIPFAILASIGLPTNLHACLFTVSLLVVLCTISIFCLVAVSVDRYWAILHPMGYSRNVRTKTALVIISVCWMAGTFIGFLPLLGLHADKTEDQKCFFVKIMDYKYLVFLYFATIITPSLVLAAFYAHIYRVVLKQLRQIVTMNPESCGGLPRSNARLRVNGGTMLRMLGPTQKGEVKATRNLSFIVLFFMICWIPLYTINCVQAFCVDCTINTTLIDFCIILSHLNSAGNPLLYAYHLRDFRAALKHYILNLFRVREKTSCADRNCQPSLMSNNCSHRIHHLRGAQQVDSPTCRPKNESRRRIPACMSIVTTTAAVAAASAGERRDMWMIAEVPSTSLSENNVERECAVFPDGESIIKDVTSDSSSGQVNSGYVEGPIDDLEIGDDDVFYADASTLSANGSNVGSDSSDIIKKQDQAVEVVRRQEDKLAKQSGRKWCLSSSSPQLSRSLFVVEGERRSSSDQKNKSNGLSVSTSGEFSPARSLKLSPFKTVGSFLLQHTSANKHSKSANKIEEVSYRDLSVVLYDASRNGAIINQKQTSGPVDS